MAAGMKKIKTRSKFEEIVIEDLQLRTTKFSYEPFRIKYNHNPSNYTPDIVLDNGIIIEIKGYFRAKDRVLHKLIRDQYPELDVRFVFQRATNRIHKKSHTTYADWCDTHGFIWAEKFIPVNWLRKQKKGKKR